MGALEDIGPILAFAAGAGALAIIAWAFVAGRRADRQQPPRPSRLEQELRPMRIYIAKARVDRRDLVLRHRGPGGDAWLDTLKRHLGARHIYVNLDPPAAGPEAELQWEIAATSLETAERIARRALERIHLPPLALLAAERDSWNRDREEAAM